METETLVPPVVSGQFPRPREIQDDSVPGPGVEGGARSVHVHDERDLGTPLEGSGGLGAVGTDGRMSRCHFGHDQDDGQDPDWTDRP